MGTEISQRTDHTLFVIMVLRKTVEVLKGSSGKSSNNFTLLWNCTGTSDKFSSTIDMNLCYIWLRFFFFFNLLFPSLIWWQLKQEIFMGCVSVGSVNTIFIEVPRWTCAPQSASGLGRLLLCAHCLCENLTAKEFCWEKQLLCSEEWSRLGRALKAAEKKYGFIINCLFNCGWQQCPGRGNYFWKPPPGLWPPLSVSGRGSINCCPKTVRLSSQQANTLLCKWRIKSENLANNLLQKLHNHQGVMMSNLQCL